jgi:2-oxo-4-hydroxy-4-carboxy-5-ureidoimidazoline decarboxylase
MRVNAPVRYDRMAAVQKADAVVMSAAPPALTLAAVNRMDRDRFVGALGGIFEHSPWVAEAAWPGVPLSSVAALHEAMVAAVRAATPERRLDLIRVHPDLAGKAARSGAMTANSVAEQASAGLLSLGDDEYARFQAFDTAYRECFGFPFIIAVQRHDKASLLAVFEARLANSRAVEIETALGEVFTIARLRLEALFGETAR